MSRQIFASTIRHIATKRGLTQKQARAVLADFFAVAADGVKYDGRFSVPGVGVFRATQRKGRNVRNPITKELMVLPLTKSVRFRPAKRGVFARGAR